MLGVYLAVNAVPDAGLLMDGPDCVMFKAEHVCGSHDLQSTLLDAGGPGRLQYSRVDTNRIIMDRSEQIADAVRSVQDTPGVNAVFVAAMPIVTITGMQHDLVLRKAGVPDTPPVLVLPEENLSYDWNDGYAAVLQSLAPGAFAEPGIGVALGPAAGAPAGRMHGVHCGIPSARPQGRAHPGRTHGRGPA